MHLKWYLCHILEMVFQFLYSKNYMKQKCSPCTPLKPFSISFLHLKHGCFEQLHVYILTGETPMLSRVNLSFFFGDSYSKKSSSDANLFCELCLNNSVMFSFSGGLVNFSHSHIACIIFDQVIHHYIIIHQSSCVRKETVDKDILVMSRNADRVDLPREKRRSGTSWTSLPNNSK